MGQKVETSLTWAARVLGLALVLLILVFGGIQVIGGGFPLSEWQIINLVVFLALTVLVTGVLWLAWKRAILGGIIYLLLSIPIFIVGLFVVALAQLASISGGGEIRLGLPLLCVSPFLLTGIMFIVSGAWKRHKPKTE